MTNTFLFSEAFLIIGLLLGWMSANIYADYTAREEHDYDELFEKNPHPELFDEDGNLNRGDYLTLNIEPGYDIDGFNPEDLSEEA